MYMKMNYHEQYGDIPTPVLRIVRKFHVSPSEYDSLIYEYGEDWISIIQVIKDFSVGGYYCESDWRTQLIVFA